MEKNQPGKLGPVEADSDNPESEAGNDGFWRNQPTVLTFSDLPGGIDKSLAVVMGGEA